MPRQISPQMLAALGSGSLRPAIFVEATFITGPVYCWTGTGPITWNGQTWLGIGTFGSLSNVEEGTTVEAKGITLTLSGLDPTLLTDVLTEYQVGLPVMVWIGLFDINRQLIPDPLVAWAGRMDQPTLSVDGTTCSLSIACENRLLDMNTSVERRYTNDDQQLDYPGDRGFEFVTSIQEVSLYWGRMPGSKNNR